MAGTDWWNYAPQPVQYIHFGGWACPAPRDGGLCGCGDDDDTPRDCLRRNCDC